VKALLGTAQLLRLVVGSAGSVSYVYSALDKTGSASPYNFAVTSGSGAVSVITTAVTQTILTGSATANLERNVEDLTVTNTSATVTNAIRVEQFDGTNAVPLWAGSLLPSEKIVFDEAGGWTYLAADGTVKAATTQRPGNLGITGALAETMPRETCPEINTAIGATGVLFLQAIRLYAGQVISSITAASATTAAGTPTNGFLCLYDGNRNLLAQTANQTTTAWAANTVKTLALTAQYIVPSDGVYYIGVMMTATTVMTMKGGTARTASQLAGTAPILSGTSTTGLTTTLPATAAAITVTTTSIYAAVS
jgi:hypothetical protein